MTTHKEQFIKPDQICSTLPKQFQNRKNQKDFGTWRLLSSGGGTLQLKREDWREIYFDHCNSSSQVLDWIFHYMSKDLTDRELIDMLRALKVILDPCRNYCSFGADKRTNGTQLMKNYLSKM